MKLMSNWKSCQAWRVLAKSALVSPGNPTMTSVEMVMSGLAFLRS